MKQILLGILCLSSLVLGADGQGTATKAQVDKIAWMLDAKHALAQEPKNLGKIVIAESLLANWEVSDRSQSTADHLNREYNRLVAQYETEVSVAESAKNFKLNPAPFKYAEIALDVTATLGTATTGSPGWQQAAPIGKAVLNGAKTAFEEEMGPAAQLHAQKKLFVWCWPMPVLKRCW